MLLEDPLARLERRPRDRDSEAAHTAPEEDAHLHVPPPVEPKRLQGQPDLDGVAAPVHAPGALPDPIGRGVFRACDGVDHVELDAARVHHQVVGDLPGPERIEAEPDPVVRPDVVAPGNRGLDACGLGIVAAKGEIKRVGIIAGPDGRGVRQGVAVKRVVGQPRSCRERRA